MSDINNVVDPEASKLGSKEHWNEAYERELKNFQSHEDDIGEIWFGEDVQNRVCDWIADGCEDDDGEEDDEQGDKSQSKGSRKFPGIRAHLSRILDIGCGNAAALVYLAQEHGFSKLTGIDYSAPGIDLAKKVVARNEDIAANIELKVVDLMDLESIYQSLQSGSNDFMFDLLFDKGTFDAICLNEDKSMRNKYVSAICAMMETNDSYFIITSCNWTRAEVIQMFESMSVPDVRRQQHEKLADIRGHGNCSLKYFKFLQHPEFSFGGNVGSTVATVAFKLVPS